MSEPISAADGTGRCPRCRARVVPGQEWCSLCLEPLVAAAGPQAGPEPAADRVDPGPPDPSGRPVGRTRPVDPSVEAGQVGAPGPAGAPRRPRAGGDLPPGVAEAMLAELAVTTASERPLARGPLAGRGRGTRLLLGCGAAVVLGVVLLLVLTLVGQLL